MASETLTCDDIEELLPAYSLGALEPGEAAGVARHLHHCARHAEALDAYDAALDGLAANVPLIDPPTRLRARLLARLAAPPARADAGRPRPARAWLGWAAAAVAAVAAIALGVWAFSLQSQIANQAAVRQELLELARQPDAHMVALQAEAGVAAKAVLIYADRKAAIWAVALPALESGQVFECWWTGKDQRQVSGGSFRSSEGVGIWFVSMPENARDYDRIGISIESEGNRSEPQGPRVLAGEF